MIEPLSWSAIAARLEPELGEPLARARRLTPPRRARATWAVRTRGAGELVPADFTHNDLHLSNVLTDGERITGVVDWDEFGLGTRALDLVVLGFDCYRIGEHRAADRMFAQAAAAAGPGGLRCMVGYRALAHLADDRREGQQDDAVTASATLFSSILDRLQEDYGGG